MVFFADASLTDLTIRRETAKPTSSGAFDGELTYVETTNYRAVFRWNTDAGIWEIIATPGDIIGTGDPNGQFAPECTGRRYTDSGTRESWVSLDGTSWVKHVIAGS